MQTEGHEASPSHVERWIRFLAYPDPAVQLRTLRALVEIDDPRATAALLDSFPRYASYAASLRR